MKLDRFIRVAIAVVVVLVFVVATGALLFITESALNVWDRLRAGPPLLLYAYFTVMVLFAMTAVAAICLFHGHGVVCRRQRVVGLAPRRKKEACCR
jgi:hypothetical protein